MAESIKRRLAEGKLVRILSVGPINSHKLIEIAGFHGGYHGVWIDQEHSALTQSEIEVLALACRAAGLDSYVRLAPTDYATAMRPMEAGAGGIMAAQVRSVEEVERIVSWAKYPPQGARGLNISNIEGNWGLAAPAEHIPRANKERWLSIQIETSEALNAVEAIAAVDGVDHLFVGPADLSVALGVPGDYLNPACVAALERVSAAVKGVGKTWGILPRGVEHARKCRELGCLLFAFAMDLGVVHAGFRAIRQQYEEFYS